MERLRKKNQIESSDSGDELQSVNSEKIQRADIKELIYLQNLAPFDGQIEEEKTDECWADFQVAHEIVDDIPLKK